MHNFNVYLDIMINVEQARNIISGNIHALDPVNISLAVAFNHVLAEDVFSAADIPPFPQSAMDGYAFQFEDLLHQQSLSVEGEIPAGATGEKILKQGQAIRIFTGAPVPSNADTVVMQEKTIIQDNQLFIEDEALVKGLNVRPKGSDISFGQLALAKGTVLSPAAIGFLAGAGVTTVKVFRYPTIHLIVTGNELQEPGSALQYGQVYESNSMMLSSALQQIGFTLNKTVHVHDNVAALTDALNNALIQADVVLLTGGVSVGDYDFVINAANACGVQQLFHKIKQRPGKPLYFGMIENKVVFGLPGNPSSVLTCFYEYVWDALLQLASLPDKKRKYHLPLASDYSKKTNLTHFLKGKIVGNDVMPLTAQESYKLSSFAVADCLIVLEEDKMEFKKGDIVEVHLLPQ